MATLEELAKNFAATAGCELEMLDNGYSGTLHLGPMNMRILQQPGSSILVLHVGVGILPQEGREELALRLLGYNDLFGQTKGLTLGLNREAEVITLQTNCDITSLSQESFANLVENVATEAVHWLEILNDPAASTPAPEKDEPQENLLNFANFGGIRI